MLTFLGLILSIVAIVLFFMRKEARKIVSQNDRSSDGYRLLANLNKSVLLGVLCLGLFLTFKPFAIVNSGYRGLRFTMGKLDNTVLGEGLAFKMPLFQSIEEVTIRPIELSYEIAVGQGGAITQDNQNIGADLTLFYSYKPDLLSTMWREYGAEKIKDINAASMKEAFKKEIGQYTIFEVAPIQEKIRRNILVSLDSTLSVYPIKIVELKITNYDWPQSFEDQIEQTMQRAQEVKQKEQELLIAEQQAQKQVKEAEAQKTAMITKAEGQKESARLMADAKVLEGEGIRKYNQSIAANWSIELKKMELEIEKIRVTKWNGQYVPNNMYGPIPFSQGGIQK